MKAENAVLRSENAALKKQNAKLEYENAWLKRQIFGSKSERLLPGADQSGLLPGFEETNESEVPAESQTIAEHTRKVRKKMVGRKSRLIFPVRIGSSISRRKSVREWS